MDRVCKIPCWNHNTGSHTVLKPHRWTCWPLTPLHDTDVLPWMSIFNLLVNERIFQYQSNATDFLNLVISHPIRHFTDTINTIIKSWNTWSWWSLEVGTPPLAERPFMDLIISSNINCNPLNFDMSMLHDNSSCYSQSKLKEKIWILPLQEILKFTSIETGTKLCLGIM